MSDEKTERRAYRVTGHVQGVGYRWWTRQTAAKLGVTGTVRNVADGSVEVVAAGRPSAVSAFRQALHRGPPGAAVERIEDIELPEELPDIEFEIVT